MSDDYLFLAGMQQRRHSKTNSMRMREDEQQPKTRPTSPKLDETDPIANILSLKLRKPKGWNWELSTSRSCTNIALPRILLYDHEGHLLVDANTQQERVYKETNVSTASRKHKRTSRAATANLMPDHVRHEFNDLQIEEVTPSPEPPASSTLNGSARRMPFSRNDSPASVEFQTTELPDYRYERRSSSFKEVRFNVDKQIPQPISPTLAEEQYFHVVDLPTPPSTTTTNTTTSSSGPSEKRRYRRSQSSSFSRRSPAAPESILERFSYTRGRNSSPEYAEEHSVEHAPRYFLRTSKAGTLVVKEESFSRYRRRRKPRYSSTENVQNDNSSKSCSSSCLKLPTSPQHSNELALPLPFGSPQSGSLQDVAQTQRIKSLPVRRYRSDGSMLLQQLSSSSSSDTEVDYNGINGHVSFIDGRKRSPRRYSLVSIDPDSGVLNAIERPTAR